MRETALPRGARKVLLDRPDDPWSAVCGRALLLGTLASGCKGVPGREPPDIDVDFEHEPREEVVQWVYETYGRRSALTATVIRSRLYTRNKSTKDCAT